MAQRGSAYQPKQPSQLLAHDSSSVSVASRFSCRTGFDPLPSRLLSDRGRDPPTFTGTQGTPVRHGRWNKPKLEWRAALHTPCQPRTHSRNSYIIPARSGLSLSHPVADGRSLYRQQLETLTYHGLDTFADCARSTSNMNKLMYSYVAILRQIGPSPRSRHWLFKVFAPGLGG
jgi:hypothetical protein